MFGFFSRKQKNNEKKQSAIQPEAQSDTAATQLKSQQQPDSTTLTPADLSHSLEKTKRTFSDGLADFFLGKKAIDASLLDELESRLLRADVGIDATTTIIEELQSNISRKVINDTESLHLKLAEIMKTILQPCEQPLSNVIANATENTEPKKPFVILVVGINGAGKTTSIGKLAHHFLQQNKSVMLAAGDTFRAAAVEQLQQWGQRNNVPVISQGTGADPASVIFDAVQSASSKNIDIVIADTAGRLHTQSNLMDELAKIKRVLGKLDANAPHETLIVMDAGFGQNALHQVKQFHDKIGLTGLAVTKLDGTAKGGILFSIAKTLNLPVRFIGVGEGINDLRPFNAAEFVDALLE
ncbi:MAG: signal recognition particle-docking protein FtsY [Gammaproteobacteria bacterium]|nr:MAG: signal recognition particle-docking protein FtsY [Gammaproteobacteria bacterium]